MTLFSHAPRPFCLQLPQPLPGGILVILPDLAFVVLHDAFSGSSAISIMAYLDFLLPLSLPPSFPLLAPQVFTGHPRCAVYGLRGSGLGWAVGQPGSQLSQGSQCPREAGLHNAIQLADVRRLSDLVPPVWLGLLEETRRWLSFAHFIFPSDS